MFSVKDLDIDGYLGVVSHDGLIELGGLWLQ